jgi:hypothetical protein
MIVVASDIASGASREMRALVSERSLTRGPLSRVRKGIWHHACLYSSVGGIVTHAKS